MNRVNRLLTLISLTTVVITLERVSPSTRVMLQPRNFLHVHEALQMGIITTFSVVVSFLLLREVSANFRLLQTTPGLVLGCLFIVGSYFYATGNGVHEVASFLFNQYCDTKHFTSDVCGSMYFDDYYAGNIVYFLGLGLSNLALVLLELNLPGTDRSQVTTATIANGLVLALTFIGYDAFDRVAVGLVSTIVFAVVFASLLYWRRDRVQTVPFTVYTVLGFVLAALVSLPMRAL